MSTLAAIALTLVAQAASQPKGVGWEHVLVRHETFEDFYAEGRAMGDGAAVDLTGLKLHVDAYKQGWLDTACLPPFERASFESDEIEVQEGFDELLPSWNAECASNVGFRVDVRVAAEGMWSPWLEIGYWGAPLPTRFTEENSTPSLDDVSVSIDVLECKRRCNRAQYRIRATADEKDSGDVRFRRAVAHAVHLKASS